MKERKAFSFYRSYYDVIVELPDEQKLPLLMAILNKQFLDVEPQLTGLPALLYKSQKHSIEKQVNGYKSKMGITTPTEGPTQGPCQGPTEANKQIEAITRQGPTQGPSVQVEGEGQVEEEVQEQVYGKNYKYIKYNKLTGEYEFEFKTKLQKEELIFNELKIYLNEEEIYNKLIINQYTN